MDRFDLAELAGKENIAALADEFKLTLISP